MPELPEVETIVRGLRKSVTGHVIEEVIVREKKIVAFPSVEEFRKGLRKRSIRGVERRGKYILLGLGENKSLIIHLRMTGKLLLKPREMEYDKHEHIIFELDNSLDLRFHNIRKFGRMYLVENRYETVGGFNKLGPEPLADEFTFELFREMLSGRKTNIKALLLDQSFLAGLGNIYTDEALFHAQISPERNSSSLNEREIRDLYNSIRKVLREGIESGGTSYNDYRDVNDEKGNYQYHLKVYQREGRECINCGAEIIRKKIAGRGTHFCPHCQK
ncbi:MAG: bifunctional DNA-formamidopyrimidine glycosylase/DNA-(apurinic or apyrimidinic site) lyase [Halanaerobiaceae bacterium]|jgi:formamidopyrimidine-DNA glycosylase|nr:bifunctional DNA-formamidopyrimidine glycosylase/DNA-(apurinic or apyrimidinic site) lyase [Halanaerobiaceae bacterium]